MHPLQITDAFYRKLKKETRKIVPGFDPEAIHRFRVEYKKLRAFLRMLSFENAQQPPLKISGKLKKAYQVSGTIRDLYLQQQRLADTDDRGHLSPKAYLKLLQKRIDELQHLFSRAIREKPVDQSRKSTIAALPEDFPPARVERYIQYQAAVICLIIPGGDLADDTLHAIRKNLKDLFYNITCAGKMGNSLSSFGIGGIKNKAYFEELLDELGNFQDKCTAIALTNPHWFGSLHPNNRELLFRARKMWIEDKLRQKQLLAGRLQELFPLLAPG